MHALAAKMRLSPEQPLHWVAAPPELTPVAAGFAAPDATSSVTQAVVFVRDASDLAVQAALLVPRLANDALLWLAFPKKTSEIPTDLSREAGWQPLTDAGYLPVTQVAVDATWTALRFKRRDAISTLRREVPAHARRTPGVDYAARTVQLPDDAAAALGALLPAFYNQSFTCQKEWAEALADAKKPDTRVRRIGKLVEALQARPVKKKP